MKKYIPIIILLTITDITFGVLFSEFKSWNDLIDGSSDIIIARCSETPYYVPPGTTQKSAWIVDNVTHSEIEVVKVLKGKTRIELSRMASWYRPHQGDLFLVFANYMSFGSNSWYNAIENYRIVPLAQDFPIADLNGKAIKEQIELILAARVKDLNQELVQANEEKKRMEAGIDNNHP